MAQNFRFSTVENPFRWRDSEKVVKILFEEMIVRLKVQKMEKLN